MFCQKCGEHIPNGAGTIVGDRLLCADCASALVRHCCQRCGCELPPGTEPQENGRLLCEKCAALPDDSADDKPFREGNPPLGRAERFRMLPVWIALLLLLLAAGAVAELFATKTLCFHNWQPATCQEPEFCPKCGHIRGEPLPHRWKEADCIHPRICTLCGAEEGEPLGHDWLDATCTDPQTCSRCGATQGEPAGHLWEAANCQHPKRCKVCGLEEGEPGEHQWRDATCEDPRTCEICGKTEGKALGHQWAKATCTEPKTCTICGKTEGSPKGHKWKDATIAAPKTCEVCGMTEGEPLRLETLLPPALMQVRKSDFIKAADDAHPASAGCSECSGSESTLTSDRVPGCVIAFGTEKDALPEHIHVFQGKVTEDTYVGMTYQELEEALGAPSWQLSESDFHVTACYEIDGHSVGFLFTDMRIFRDVIAAQISGKSTVTIRQPQIKTVSARIS